MSMLVATADDAKALATRLSALPKSIIR